MNTFFSLVMMTTYVKFALGEFHVMVSDFLPLFNNSRVASVDFPMKNIYDKAHCPGDHNFISRANAAPSTFCLSSIHIDDLNHVIGSEWWWKWTESDLKKWVTSVIPSYDNEYDNALRTHVKNEGLPLKFDQFALERIMLARWQNKVRDCRGRGGCSSGVPQAIVVPSLLAHMQQLLWKDHLAWNLLVPMDCIPDGTNILPSHCKGGYGNIDLHRRYWKMVRRTHFRPYCLGDRVYSINHGACEKGTPPLIVITHSFVWDQTAFLSLLKALYEQPPLFIEHVVIATIESNFKVLSSLTEAGFPLKIQNSCSRPDYPYNLHAQQGSGQPLFVTLPYPTGLSVDHSSNFVLPSSTKEVAYNDHMRRKPRPISLLLDADLDRKGGGGKVMMNWIRQLLRSKVIEGGGTCQGAMCTLCQNEDNTITACNKRWPLYDEKWPSRSALMPTLWEATVSSSFCLEPAGDTLTRSHFYAAVLSGCIPVIFDGGVDDFEPDEATCWAWRGNGKRGTLDYSDFTVIYKATDIRDDKVDIIKELIEMPLLQPERYKKLRRGVDLAAEAMRYSSTPSEDMSHPDAFDRFSLFISEFRTAQEKSPKYN